PGWSPISAPQIRKEQTRPSLYKTMSSTNKYQKTYSGADIEKYLKGELSAREMHDLEAAALEDPFLADALDGMSVRQSLPPAVGLTHDLNDLRMRLDAKTATTPAGHTRRIPVAL